MIKTLTNINLTVVTSKENPDFNKMSGRLEMVDNANFLFSETERKKYDPKPRFYDGNCLTVTLSDDCKTVRCYMKSFELSETTTFLEELYKEVQSVGNKLINLSNSEREEE